MNVDHLLYSSDLGGAFELSEKYRSVVDRALLSILVFVFVAVVQSVCTVIIFLNTNVFVCVLDFMSHGEYF